MILSIPSQHITGIFSKVGLCKISGDSGVKASLKSIYLEATLFVFGFGWTQHPGSNYQE